MRTDQAQRLVTLHDNADRALANLRNAAAMSREDPRATELLEEGGDAYAETLVALTEAQDAIIDASAPPEGGLLDSEDRAREAAAGVGYPEGYEPGKAAWIVGGDADDGNFGAGIIVDGVGGVVEGNVALRLTAPAKFRGQEFPEGATISVPTTTLTLEQPEGAPSVDVTASEKSGEGQAAKTA